MDLQDEVAAVRLTWQYGRLVGRANGEAVDIEAAPGRSAGSCGDAAFAVDWSSGSNYRLPAGEELPARLKGQWAGAAVQLDGAFKLDSPLPLFARGSVSGHVGPVEVRAGARRVRGATTSTVLLDGNWGNVPFALLTGVNADKTRAVVRGQVGAERTRIVVTAAEEAMSVEGEYQGPPAFLLAIVFCLLKFTGALYAVPTPVRADHSDVCASAESVVAGLIEVWRTTVTKVDPRTWAETYVHLYWDVDLRVLDEVRPGTPDPVIDLAISEPAFSAAHRVACDLDLTTNQRWVLAVALLDPEEPLVAFRPAPRSEESVPGSRGRDRAESVIASLDMSERHDAEAAAVALARSGQRAVHEADRPWPRCTGHEHAAEPALLGGIGVWSCPSDGRAVARIGELGRAMGTGGA